MLSKYDHHTLYHLLLRQKETLDPTTLPPFLSRFTNTDPPPHFYVTIRYSSSYLAKRKLLKNLVYVCMFAGGGGGGVVTNPPFLTTPGYVFPTPPVTGAPNTLTQQLQQQVTRL
jgi:hypothetical protein